MHAYFVRSHGVKKLDTILKFPSQSCEYMGMTNEARPGRDAHKGTKGLIIGVS